MLKLELIAELFDDSGTDADAYTEDYDCSLYKDEEDSKGSSSSLLNCIRFSSRSFWILSCSSFSSICSFIAASQSFLLSSIVFTRFLSFRFLIVVCTT